MWQNWIGFDHSLQMVNNNCKTGPIPDHWQPG